MKKILFFLLTISSLTAQAQVVKTDGNTLSSVAATERQYLFFLDDTFNTRIRCDFSTNSDATVATTKWRYEYQIIHDSTNVEWKWLSGGTINTPISFDALKVALFQKVRDSTTLQNVDFLTPTK